MLSRQIKQSFARNLGHTANVFGQQGAAYSWQKEAMRAGEEEKQLEKAKPLDEFFGIYKGVELKNEGTEMLPKKLIDVGHFYSMRVGPQKPLANIPRRKTQQPRRQRQYENRQVTGVRPPTEAFLKVEEKEAKQTPIGRLVKEYDRQRDILAELNRLNDQFAAAADYVGHSTAGTFGEFISFADKKAMLIADAVRRITVLEPDQREAAYAKAMRHFDNMTFATYMARKAGVTGTTPEMQEELRILEERMGQGSLRRHRQYLTNHQYEHGEEDGEELMLGDDIWTQERIIPIEELPEEAEEEKEEEEQVSHKKPRHAAGAGAGEGEGERQPKQQAEEDKEEGVGGKKEYPEFEPENFTDMEKVLVKKIRSNFKGSNARRSVYLSGLALSTMTSLANTPLQPRAGAAAGDENYSVFGKEQLQEIVDKFLSENVEVKSVAEYKEKVKQTVLPYIRDVKNEELSLKMEALFLAKLASKHTKKSGKYTERYTVPIGGGDEELEVSGIASKRTGPIRRRPDGKFVTDTPITLKDVKIVRTKRGELRAKIKIKGNLAYPEKRKVMNTTRMLNIDLSYYR